MPKKCWSCGHFLSIASEVLKKGPNFGFLTLKYAWQIRHWGGLIWKKCTVFTAQLHYFLESLFNKREMSNVRNVTSSYTELNLVLLSLKPFGTTIGINEWIIMFDKCLNVFSSQMINWHPWQLKKSKSWRPFWRYQLNSTTNPGHLPRKWANTVLFSWYLQNGP